MQSSSRGRWMLVSAQLSNKIVVVVLHISFVLVQYKRNRIPLGHIMSLHLILLKRSAKTSISKNTCSKYFLLNNLLARYVQLESSAYFNHASKKSYLYSVCFSALHIISSSNALKFLSKIFKTFG